MEKVAAFVRIVTLTNIFANKVSICKIQTFMYFINGRESLKTSIHVFLLLY